MAKRSSVAILFGLASGSLGVALLIALAVYLTGPRPMLHDVASVVRMPIPGTADVDLSARGYGLYFGDLNAPTGKVMHVPTLDITIVPPKGVADPGYVNVAPKVDVYVDGFHTVQVASIAVRKPGTYHVHVESQEENGGSFSIGELPAVIDPAHNVVRATPFIGLFVVVGVVLGVSAALISRKAA